MAVNHGWVYARCRGCGQEFVREHGSIKKSGGCPKCTRFNFKISPKRVNDTGRS